MRPPASSLTPVLTRPELDNLGVGDFIVKFRFIIPSVLQFRLRDLVLAIAWFWHAAVASHEFDSLY